MNMKTKITKGTINLFTKKLKTSVPGKVKKIIVLAWVLEPAQISDFHRIFSWG